MIGSRVLGAAVAAILISTVGGLVGCSSSEEKLEPTSTKTIQAASVSLVLHDATGARVGEGSGILLSPRTVLTSAHLIAGKSRWTVTSADGKTKVTGIRGQTYDWMVYNSDKSHPRKHDVGIIYLDRPIDLPVYPRLATGVAAKGAQATRIRGTGGSFQMLPAKLDKWSSFPHAYLADAPRGETLDTGGAVLNDKNEIIGLVTGRGVTSGKLHIARTAGLSEWLSPKVACGTKTNANLSLRTYSTPPPKPGCDNSSGGTYNTPGAPGTPGGGGGFDASGNPTPGGGFNEDGSQVPAGGNGSTSTGGGYDSSGNPTAGGGYNKDGSQVPAGGSGVTTAPGSAGYNGAGQPTAGGGFNQDGTQVPAGGGGGAGGFDSNGNPKAGGGYNSDGSQVPAGGGSSSGGDSGGSTCEDGPGNDFPSAGSNGSTNPGGPSSSSSGNGTAGGGGGYDASGSPTAGGGYNKDGSQVPSGGSGASNSGGGYDSAGNPTAGGGYNKDGSQVPSGGSGVTTAPGSAGYDGAGSPTAGGGFNKDGTQVPAGGGGGAGGFDSNGNQQPGGGYNADGTQVPAGGAGNNSTTGGGSTNPGGGGDAESCLGPSDNPETCPPEPDGCSGSQCGGGQPDNEIDYGFGNTAGGPSSSEVVVN